MTKKEFARRVIEAFGEYAKNAGESLPRSSLEHHWRKRGFRTEDDLESGLLYCIELGLIEKHQFPRTGSCSYKLTSKGEKVAAHFAA